MADAVDGASAFGLAATVSVVASVVAVAAPVAERVVVVSVVSVLSVAGFAVRFAGFPVRAAVDVAAFAPAAFVLVGRAAAVFVLFVAAVCFAGLVERVAAALVAERVVDVFVLFVLSFADVAGLAVRWSVRLYQLATQR